MTTTVQRVHDLYWNSNLNCARAMLACLGETFGVTVAPQTFHAAVGMHGAGRFRASAALWKARSCSSAFSARSAARRKRT